jgi:hypothetical protein
MAIISKQYFLVGTTDSALKQFVDPINGAVVSSTPINITVQADSTQVDALDEYMASLGWRPGTLGVGDLGWFGTGVDGNLVFNGATTLLGMVPAGNVYTMFTDIFAADLTVNAGVTIRTAGFRIYVSGTLTIVATGFIANDGEASTLGNGSPGNGAFVGNVLGGGDGGAGGLGADGTPGVGVAFYPSRSAGAGGGGGNAVVHVGGAGGVAVPQFGFGTYMISTMALGDAVSGGAGGGGGGGDIAVVGGGGGGGGGVIVICAKHIEVPANAIRARGGDGDDGSAGDAGGGGGGQGGTIIIVTNDDTAPTVDVSGGVGGTAAGGGIAGSPGSAGVRIAISPAFGPL